ncbi:MAG: hypothetical protein AAFX94_22915, partial [Myxococcota bacterium]
MLAQEEFDRCGDFCAFSPGAGVSGGDLYRYTLPGINHPVDNDVGRGTCYQPNNTPELVIEVDMDGFNTIRATTCTLNPSDSAIIIYDRDPSSASDDDELACDRTGGTPNNCSVAEVRVGDDPSTVFVVVDDAFIATGGVGSFWDGSNDKRVDI